MFIFKLLENRNLLHIAVEFGAEKILSHLLPVSQKIQSFVLNHFCFELVSKLQKEPANMLRLPVFVSDKKFKTLYKPESYFSDKFSYAE